MHIDITTVLTAVLALVLAGVAADYFTKAFVALKKWSATKQYGWALEMVVESACLIAEKLYKSGQGKQKLQWALNYIRQECNTAGIDFDPIVVTNMINDFVEKVLNEGKNLDSAAG